MRPTESAGAGAHVGPMDFAAVHADALSILHSWRSPVAAAAAAQDDVRRDILNHLRQGPASVWRAGGPIHLTASCLVLDPGLENVLLTLHRRAQAWFQFGGHLDAGDATVWGAATREAREESGIVALAPLKVPVHLDRHSLVGSFGACREHLDVRFVAVAPADSPLVVSEESHDVAWWPLGALPDDSDADLGELIAAGVAAVRS